MKNCIFKNMMLFLVLMGMLTIITSASAFRNANCSKGTSINYLCCYVQSAKDMDYLAWVKVAEQGDSSNWNAICAANTSGESQYSRDTCGDSSITVYPGNTTIFDDCKNKTQSPDVYFYNGSQKECESAPSVPCQNSKPR